MKAERFDSGPTQCEIRGIEGDMGEETRINLLVKEDGDVTLSLIDPQRGMVEIDFNALRGGTHNSIMARTLRALAFALTEPAQDKQEQVLLQFIKPSLGQ